MNKIITDSDLVYKEIFLIFRSKYYPLLSLAIEEKKQPISIMGKVNPRAFTARSGKFSMEVARWSEELTDTIKEDILFAENSQEEIFIEEILSSKTIEDNSYIIQDILQIQKVEIFNIIYVNILYSCAFSYNKAIRKTVKLLTPRGIKENQLAQYPEIDLEEIIK